MIPFRALASALVFFLCTPALAQDISWSVVNPFRFYKNEKSFERHREAYNRVIARNIGTLPANIVQLVELELNTPDCADRSSYDRCAATPGPNYVYTQQGWAARSVGEDEVCYGAFGKEGRPGYPKTCDRETGDGDRAENYINPRVHAVRVRLSAKLKGENIGKTCKWSWQASGGDGTLITRNQSCETTLLIQNVPYPRGVDVSVTRFDGTPVARTEIAVRDVLVVGLGDSFASGEGNPDQPVRLWPSHPMGYDGQTYEHPMRRTSEILYGSTLQTNEGIKLFRNARAHWISRDCHRSQYSYQFRTALQLALEDPHRAVTLVHLACTGAEATEGIFGEKPAREAGSDKNKTVEPQLDQLLDLVCENRAGGKVSEFLMRAPKNWGSPATIPKKYFIRGCKDNKLLRNIDLVLLSLGGNDIGFSALVGYSIMNSAGTIAEVATLVEAVTKQRITYPPVPSYLDMLDQRIAATRNAITNLLRVDPKRVVHSGYEAMQVDQNDALCEGPRGMDLHSKLAFNKARVTEVDKFSKSFFARLECISDSNSAASCSKKLATGAGTGFHFVTASEAFKARGICASNADDSPRMAMPRHVGGAFTHFTPQNYLPFAPRRRLFVTPNDAFLAANSHDERVDCKLFNFQCSFPTDKVQLGFAALMSGSFHRNAEGHAIIADTVLGSKIREQAGLKKPAP